VCKDKYDDVAYVLKRSDRILNRYIVFNLLDAFIVGIVNAIFMTIVGLPYIGLVSMVVAVTNLIPTFGAFIGGALGAFLLLLVQPWYAVAFIIFTFVLQTVDGYILKPKLVGDSLGVSGLWVLIGVIVGGKMFGMIGILLAIPGVAILEMLYLEFLLPWLEKERK
jgi:predicted PurR-regulated permease PerM